MTKLCVRTQHDPTGDWRLRKAWPPFLSKSCGFTLIELLVVISVIGVLTAIATPQYIMHRQRSIDAQMRSDLKNAAIAMEAYFGDKYSYPTTVLELETGGFRQTNNVGLVITITSSTSYTLTASKPNGSQPSFTYNSVTGIIQ